MTSSSQVTLDQSSINVRFSVSAVLNKLFSFSFDCQIDYSGTALASLQLPAIPSLHRPVRYMKSACLPVLISHKGT